MNSTWASWQSRLNIFRKPISWPWRVGLGVAALVTFVALYTIGSHVRQSADPNDMLLPSWYQLWTQGVLPSFAPEIKGEVPRGPEEQARVKEEGERLERQLRKPQEERLDDEEQRLRRLAGAF